MPQLALVMIVRNEAKTIERCLNSAKPFVDQMIVLDTGSTDDTVARAKAAGAAVHRYTWSNDFAAARNAALGHSEADWNLVLDADEWIEGGGDALRKAIMGDEFLGQLPITNQFDLNGKVESSIVWIPRLLPKGVRYEGIIHEQPVSDLPKKPIATIVRHDGYRQSALDAKKGRNEQLLLEALKNKPNDAFLLYELGKTSEVYSEFDKAIGYFEQALPRTQPEDIFYQDLVVRSIVALKSAGKLQQAIALAEQEYDRGQESPDFFFALGDLYLECASKQPAQAAELLPLVEFSWKKCLLIGEKPLKWGTIRGRGSYLAAENLAAFYKELNLPELAAEYEGKAKQLRAA